MSVCFDLTPCNISVSVPCSLILDREWTLGVDVSVFWFVTMYIVDASLCVSEILHRPRMHSSRMCTACFSGHFVGSIFSRGRCVWLCGCLPRWVFAEVGVCLGGCLPRVGVYTTPLWTESQTGIKTLPCPKLHFRAVIIHGNWCFCFLILYPVKCGFDFAPCLLIAFREWSMRADVGVFWADNTEFKHAQWDNKYKTTTNILPITPSPFTITFPFVVPK